MIGQIKPRRNAPHKWFKRPWGHSSLSLWARPFVYPHVLFFLLIDTLPVSLLSVSLWKFISCKATQARALSLATGLVARIQHSHCLSLWVQSLAGNWNPSSSHCRPRPSKINRMLLSLAKRYFWAYLPGCFWKRFLAFESGAWAKQMVLPNLGRHHPIWWGSDRTKRQRKVGLALCPTAWAGALIFSCLHCCWSPGLQPRTRALSSWTFKLHDLLSWVSNL